MKLAKFSEISLNFTKFGEIWWFSLNLAISVFSRNGPPKYLIFHWLEQHFQPWAQKVQKCKNLTFREISEIPSFSLNFTKFHENRWIFNFCAPKLKPWLGAREYCLNSVKSLPKIAKFHKIKKFAKFRNFREKADFYEK